MAEYDVLQPPAEEAAQPMRCPQCGQVDKVQKVSAIYKGSAPGRLTWELAPPRRPGVRLWIWAGIVAAVLVFAGALVFALSLRAVTSADVLRQEREARALGPAARHDLAVRNGSRLLASEQIDAGYFLALASLPALGTLWYLRERDRRRARAHLPAWERRAQVWMQAWYCARCDGVYLAGREHLLRPYDAWGSPAPN